jgi:hypothetical protein
MKGTNNNRQSPKKNSNVKHSLSIGYRKTRFHSAGLGFILMASDSFERKTIKRYYRDPDSGAEKLFLP